MQSFKIFTGIVVPLNKANVDTDVIMPKQFLKSIKRTGFGPYLFDSWRYLDKGEPGQDCSSRPKNPDFVLNNSQYQGATILLTQANFGCGSSREHAQWGLMEYGFKAIIAPSFAEIFYNNCIKNGLVPIVLPQVTVNQLFSAIEAITLNTPQQFKQNLEQQTVYKITVHLADQQLVLPDKSTIDFDFDPTDKHRLLEGLDDIELTLLHKQKILEFEAQRRQQAPWLFT